MKLSHLFCKLILDALFLCIIKFLYISTYAEIIRTLIFVIVEIVVMSFYKKYIDPLVRNLLAEHNMTT